MSNNCFLIRVNLRSFDKFIFRKKVLWHVTTLVWLVLTFFLPYVSSSM